MTYNVYLVTTAMYNVCLVYTIKIFGNLFMNKINKHYAFFCCLPGQLHLDYLNPNLSFDMLHVLLRKSCNNGHQTESNQDNFH